MRLIGAEDPLLESLVVAGSYPRAREAYDRGLVVLAMGLPCWITRREDRSCDLLVHAEVVDAVRRQLQLFEVEDRRFRRLTRRMRGEFAAAREQGVEPLKRGLLRAWAPISAIAVVLVAFFIGQIRYPEWLESIGANDAEAVFGQFAWWRCVTALCLHADIGHIAGNLGAILLYGLLLMQRMRAGTFIFLSMMTGAVGNFLTAALYFPEQHRAIGASTMAFSMLGLILSEGIRERILKRREKHDPDDAHPVLISRFPRTAVPVVTGLILLGWFGSAPGSDVIAHGAGLIAGFVAGLTRAGESQRSQPLMLASALVLSAAWAAALISGN